MPETTRGPHLTDVDRRQRHSLLLFYLSAVLFLAAQLTATWLISVQRAAFRVLAFGIGALAIGSLYRLFTLSDERQKQINYQALQFGFLATLVVSLMAGLVRGFSVIVVSWGGVLAFLLIVWSVGLILASWRYR
jgi:hypothetical protein